MRGVPLSIRKGRLFAIAAPQNMEYAIPNCSASQCRHFGLRFADVYRQVVGCNGYGFATGTARWLYLRDDESTAQLE